MNFRISSSGLTANQKNSLRFSVKPMALACALVCLGNLSAIAQTTPDPAAEQRRQQERENVLRQRLEQPREAPQIAAPAPVLDRLPKAENPCFPIFQITLKGDLNEQFQWLLGTPATSPNYLPTSNPLAGVHGDDNPIGKCLGTQGVDLILRRLQNALVEKGFTTTRVLAAPQDLKSGTLTLTLVPGRIRAIKLAPQSNANRATLWNALPFKSGDLLNLRDIEQALENLRRSPTVEADIQIAPAEDPKSATPNTPAPKARPGDSDLIITYKQSLPIRLSVGLDDSGSKTTGKHIANATVSLDNLFTLNDMFYANATRSIGHAFSDVTTGAPGSIFGGTAPGDRGNASETIHYEIPYEYWLLGATASQNRYHQAVVGANQNYMYLGAGSNVDAKLARLIYRDANNKSTVYLKGFRRSNHSYIEDVEVLVQRRIEVGWEIGLNHRLLFKTNLDASNQATLDFNASYKQGTGAFGALTAPEDAFGEGTSRFKITTADATLSLPMKLGTQKLAYTAAVRGQYNGIPFRTSVPLTPIDQFAIGGRYTVRGFNGESSLAGNNGVTWRNDLAWDLGSVGLAGQSFYVALDAGWIGGWVKNDPAITPPVGTWLAGAAIGFKGNVKLWGVPPAQYRGLQYDIFLATPVYKPQYFQAAKLTGGFSLTANF